MKKLSLNEQIFLIAILRLGENAYGVTIRDAVIALTGHSMVFGTVYNSLENLVRKGLVTTRSGEAATQRGGHNKVYYSLTRHGILALKSARELQEKLWAGIDSTFSQGEYLK